MNKLMFKIASLSFAFFVLTASANSQELKSNDVKKTLGTTKRVAIVVVGQSAKWTYKAAKFSADKIAKPIIVKSTPKVVQFTVKQSGKALRASFPVAKKMFVQYVKYKFLP